MMLSRQLTKLSRGFKLISLFGLVLLLSACSGKITPPPEPEVSRQVFVLNHGRHSSLVLEGADGDLKRYSYGDWRFYAEGQTSFFSGLRALFVPTKSALGRKELPGPATLDNVIKQVNILIINSVTLNAEAMKVDQLKAELDNIYQQNQASKIYRPDFDLYFVHHPNQYHTFHNSNQIIGIWLNQLGSEIHGWPLLSDWQLQKD